MKNALRTILAAMALMWTGASLADQWSATPVTITGYFIWQGTGAVAFITTSSNQNPFNCPNANYLVLDPSKANFQYMWASILTAQASGQTVSLSYTACLSGYPAINAVAVPHNW